MHLHHINGYHKIFNDTINYLPQLAVGNSAILPSDRDVTSSIHWIERETQIFHSFLK